MFKKTIHLTIIGGSIGFVVGSLISTSSLTLLFLMVPLLIGFNYDKLNSINI